MEKSMKKCANSCSIRGSRRFTKKSAKACKNEKFYKKSLLMILYQIIRESTKKSAKAPKYRNSTKKSAEASRY